jgi:hypothetical protein
VPRQQKERFTLIEIEFYNFSKKSNSTARPNNGTVISCELKRETTFQSPSFLIRYDMNDFLSFNYCKWNDHYYFINNVTCINASQIEVSCTEDVLATYKEEIGNYTCVIERSSHQSLLYPDAMYLPDDSWKKDATIIAEPVGLFPKGYSGNFIVRTTSSDGITLYYMTQEELDDLLSFMWSDGSWGDALKDAFTKLFFDPFKYILSIDWCPIRIDNFIHLSSTVKLGFWDSKVSGAIIGGINAPSVNFSYDIGITNSRYNKYQFQYWNSNFSRYFVKLPFVGVIQIDITKTANDQLTADYYYDAVSGLCEVWLRSGQNDLAHFQTKLSVPIQIGFATNNPSNILNGVANTGLQLMTGNVIGATTSGLESIKGGLTPDSSIIGSNGSITAILSSKDAAQYTYTCSSIVPYPPTEGYADGNRRKINTLSGYLKCRNASVAINGYSGDQDMVNNFLNNGFYYE